MKQICNSLPLMQYLHWWFRSTALAHGPKGRVMEISKKTDYAIRMLAELVRSGDEVVSVRQAAENNSIPYSFARSIQHDLVLAGVIESVRGSHGGMRLAIDPKETTVRQIVEAVQGPIHVQSCDSALANDGLCLYRPECNFSPIWCEAESILHDFFDSVTLYQVVVEKRCPMLVPGHQFVALTPEERQAMLEK